MKHELKVPSAGESVTEAFVGQWKKPNGAIVKKGDVIVDVESQKATFEIEAEFSGRLEIIKEPDAKVAIGEVIAYIDDTAAGEAAAAGTESAAKASASNGHAAQNQSSSTSPKAGPSVRKTAEEHGVNLSNVTGTGPHGTITKQDLFAQPAQAASQSPQNTPTTATPQTPIFNYTVDATRGERLKKATRLRKQVASRLVAAQHTAAILTSFNEVDMSAIMSLREKYKESVLKKHGVKIGMVGVFAMAAVRALKEYPLVNSTFTGEDIIERDFVDLSIAVSTERGLVVPVIRDADKLDWIGFEKKLGEVAAKARDGKLSIPEMTGGTFTITNGGVFGSLVSTPLLNMPQSAILGLHTIKERPIAVNGKVEIRPMMYLALSYDHRLLDGKDAVLFLIKIKEAIEKPELMIDEASLK